MSTVPAPDVVRAGLDPIRRRAADLATLGKRINVLTWYMGAAVRAVAALPADVDPADLEAIARRARLVAWRDRLVLARADAIDEWEGVLWRPVA